MDDLISREAMGDALNRMRVSIDETWYSFYQKALNELCNLPSAQQWHVIEKRPMTEDEWKELSERLGYDGEYEDTYIYSNLPDDGQDVLVSTQCGRVYMESFCEDGCYFEANGDMEGIVAWMPSPKPYKEEEDA